MSKKAWKELAESVETTRTVVATLIALLPAGLSVVAIDLVPPWPRGAVLCTGVLCVLTGSAAYLLRGNAPANRLLLLARLLFLVGFLAIGALLWSNSRYVVNPTPAGDGGDRGVRTVRGFDVLRQVREDFDAQGEDVDRLDAEELLENFQWRAERIWGDVSECRLVVFACFALPFVLISSSLLVGAMASALDRQAARESRRPTAGPAA